MLRVGVLVAPLPDGPPALDIPVGGLEAGQQRGWIGGEERCDEHRVARQLVERVEGTAPRSRISGSHIRAAPTSIHSVSNFDTRAAVPIPLNHSSRTRSAESCAKPCTFAFAASSVRGWIRNSKRALKRSARRIRR